MRKIVLIGIMCSTLSLSAQTRSKAPVDATQPATEAGAAAPKKKPSMLERLKAKAQRSADRIVDSAGKSVENATEKGTKAGEDRLAQADTKVAKTLEGDKATAAAADKPASSKR